jgi:hypothetical protein
MQKGRSMGVSVTEPVGKAIDRTGRVLFKPFDLGKWFGLGFCAWLASLLEGGGTGNYSNDWQQQRGKIEPKLQEALNWLEANLVTVIIVGALILFVMFAIGALLSWLRSRGRFMFIDGIVQNRGSVVEPWRAYKDLGDDLFLFAFILWFAGTLVFIAMIALGLYIAWPDIEAWRFGDAAMNAIIVVGSLVLAKLLIFSVVRLLLYHLVVPTMYACDQPVLEAWSTVRREMLSAHLGSVVGFFLMKLVLAIATGMIAFAASCLTCCIAAIPYIGTVILLPLIVFNQSYTLHFVEQFGPAFRMFDEETEDDPVATA